MKPILFLWCAFFFSIESLAQNLPDSVKILEPFTVQGYLYNRSLSETPASLGILSGYELSRFGDASILPAVNTIPGVRMEERSPGSYRLSIRGSAIRSPFGVRNVKVYWNGLPFTDGGGNTYLNLFDFSSIHRIEVIKGPGGSMYGAGTGGVILLNSHAVKENEAEASIVLGSYGLKRYQFRANLVGNKIDAIVNYGRFQSDGYRDQSRMRRDALNAQINFAASAATTLSANLLLADVFYETPGGLTLHQFNENPRQARLVAGMFSGAVEQNANVRNQTMFTGVRATHEWNRALKSSIAVYFAVTDFTNYAIANFEQRDEKNGGYRNENTYEFAKGEIKGKFSLGSEYQLLKSPINVKENNSGSTGLLLITDDLRSNQLVAFAQVELDLPMEFFLTVGISESWTSYDFRRTFPDQQDVEKKFDAVLSPRIALLKKLGKFSIHGSASRGFSPPTLAEVRPSTNVFNSELFPESGTNYEAGARATIGTFRFDLTQYFFHMRETIILDRVENGAEYFVNAGKTKQTGTELTMSWSKKKSLSAWGSFAYNHYRFSEYGDFSGNEITGVPSRTATLGLDVITRPGIYLNTTYSYTGTIPLDDGNQNYSEDYFLLNVRAGIRKDISEKFTFDAFASVDNGLDEKYSLGNDLNARGGRFYNPAARRNFSLGLKLRLR